MPSRTNEEAIRLRREREREIARRENGKKRKRKNRAGKIIVIAVLAVMLVAALVTLSLTVFFNVSTITVSGETAYDSAQIVSVSGISEGENMLLMNTGEISNRITASLPYIRSVELKRRLPATLEIQCVADEPYLKIKTDGDYILLDDSYKTLGFASESDAVTVTGAVCTDSVPGVKAEFSEGQEKTLTGIINALKSENLEKIDVIDITSPIDIKIKYQNKYVIKLGSDTSLEYKLKFALKVSETENQEGVIDVTALTAENNKGFFSAKSIVNEISE